MREIGRRLGTTHVLEGSVRRNGDAVRVTVKLVATESGYQIWTDSFDASRNDVLSVQEQIARAVATNLEVRLTQNTLHRFDIRRSTNGEAYRLYLVARHHLRERTQADNAQAIELFRNVIELDDRFALAYVGLAKRVPQSTLLRGSADHRDRGRRRAAARTSSAAATRSCRALRNAGRARNREVATGSSIARPATRRAARPEFRVAYGELGFLYLTSGQPRDALSSYARASVLDPLSGILQAQRCMALQDPRSIRRSGARMRASPRARSQNRVGVRRLGLHLGEVRGRLGGCGEVEIRVALDRGPKSSRRSPSTATGS